MKQLKIENFCLLSLSENEMINISGGHNGVAYNIGHAIGDGVKKVGEVMGFIIAVAWFVTGGSGSR